MDEELAQRLAPLRLRVPPLRERTDDLRSLAFLALDRACRVLGRPALGIDDDALALLRAHPWPGNLAELQSVLDRAALAAEGRTVTRRNLEALAELGSVPSRDPQLLQEAPTPPPEAEAPDGSTMPEPELDIVGAPDPLDGTYAAVERRLLERALEKTGGNKSAAARLLGLKRTTFLDKVRRHHLLV
ncbi:MAG TPA: helix-turn-helix domain-containing protein [Polyangiaceae bacterium LLY-WYZ-14_1]|nr:helix-turn-helix domain-containing protein [Polyangiaceae bacterium LLY-WYZ-14_1]